MTYTYRQRHTTCVCACGRRGWVRWRCGAATCAKCTHTHIDSEYRIWVVRYHVNSKIPGHLSLYSLMRSEWYMDTEDKAQICKHWIWSWVCFQQRFWSIWHFGPKQDAELCQRLKQMVSELEVLGGWGRVSQFFNGRAFTTWKRTQTLKICRKKSTGRGKTYFQMFLPPTVIMDPRILMIYFCCYTITRPQGFWSARNNFRTLWCSLARQDLYKLTGGSWCIHVF